jgi:hypothetical protein
MDIEIFCLGSCIFMYLILSNYVLYSCLKKSHVYYSKKLNDILTCLKKQKFKKL